MSDVLAWPARALRATAFGWRVFVASWTDSAASAFCGDPIWRLAETNCRKTRAHGVLRRPACWALLAWGENRLLACLAKRKLGEALAGWVRCAGDVLPRPAGVALAFSPEVSITGRQAKGWLVVERTQRKQ